MRGSIRRFLFLRLLAAVAATGVFTGIGCVAAGNLLFRDSMERSIRASVEDAGRRFRIFDLVIAKVIDESRGAGRSALEAIADRYPGCEDAAEASVGELDAAAAALGVDEIYFIAYDGKVFATSFPTDLGLDFFSLDGDFPAYLRSVMSREGHSDQGVSLGTLTGKINFYQYLNFPERGMVVEISRELGSLVSRAYPSLDYASLAAMVFGGRDAAERNASVVIEDYLDKEGKSFLWQGQVNGGAKRYIDRSAAEGRMVTWRDGGTRKMVDRLDVSMASQGSGLFLLLSADERPLGAFVLGSASFAAFATAAIGAIAYAWTRRSFAKRFVLRLEGIAENMDRVAKGGGVEILDDRVGDELSVIGRVAADMVSEIHARNLELAALAARLEEEAAGRAEKERALSSSLDENLSLLREVNHRVKNNLQFIASLAQLEARQAAGPEAVDALAKVESRIQCLAIVEDQLLANQKLGECDLGDLMREIASGVALSHAGRAAIPSCTVESGGVKAGPDDAIALALACREFVDNAFRHAYGPDEGGRIEISVDRSPSGGYGLTVRDFGRGTGEGPAREGLGFTISRAVVAQRGGRMEAGGVDDGAGFSARVFVGRSIAPCGRA